MNTVPRELAGAWRLRSFENRTSAGKISYPFGRDAKGYLIMTIDGHWSVTVMSPNRPRFTSHDVLGGTTEEKVSAADGYISYAGRYQVMDERILVEPEVSFFPNWIGVQQERFFKIRGNTLELSTSPILALRQKQVAHLVWERISSTQEARIP